MVNVEVEKLLDCVAVPDKETEYKLYIISQGIDRIVQEYQETIVSKAGLYIRFKAIRTEKH